MPKKKTARQRDAARERARRGERRREEHARLIVERSGDPNYAQRQRTDDGVVVSWTKDSIAGREFDAALAQQFAAFREKFGRDPGPDDPIFFDPTADEPREMTEANFDEMIEDLIPAAEAAGIDPAHMLAWREVGYLVTEMNRHTFSLAEITAYEEAVQRHQAGREAAIGE